MAKHGKPKTGKAPKKFFITLVILLCVAAAAVGGYYLLKHFTGKEVNVYPVEDLSMNYAWATEAQTDGRVTTDRIQSVYISETQQITEIYVEEGQAIAIGDPILAFDTTLSELELDRQAIKVSQLELDIREQEEKLAEIDTYKIGSPSYNEPVYDNSYSEDLIIPAYLPYYQKGVGTATDPMVYLWNDDCTYDTAFMASLVALSAELKAAQNPPEDTDTPAGDTDPPAEDTDTPAEDTDTPAEDTDTPAEDADPPAEDTDPPVEDTNPPTEDTDTPAGDADPPVEDTDPPAGDTDTPAGDVPNASEEQKNPYVYVVFEVRDSDAINGTVLRNWEMAILMNEDGTWSFQIVEPVYEPAEDASSGYVPEVYVDDTVYYSASEIAQMKAETKQKIIDLKLELKMAELEYDRLSYELSNGIVYSTVDGVVKNLRDPEIALAENEPVVLVSGGGGYYITAALSEMELASMAVGDTVTIQSWENYTTIEDAAIVEISEYPDETGQYWHYSEGNQNVSLYPFTVFVSEDASLREGEWVTITYTPGGEETEGFYVEVPFIREENGKSYVYTPGKDGRLEKRFVATGGNLWGSYIKILDGLTTEDYIAFPYGRSVEEGAKTRIAGIDELYSY